MSKTFTREDLEKLSSEDKAYIDTTVRKAYEDMETHMEVFTLPSGATLNVWCDGQFTLLQPEI